MASREEDMWEAMSTGTEPGSVLLESSERDGYNDFRRALGEEPDPDAPFEFPQMEFPPPEERG